MEYTIVVETSTKEYETLGKVYKSAKTCALAADRFEVDFAEEKALEGKAFPSFFVGAL